MGRQVLVPASGKHPLWLRWADVPLAVLGQLSQSLGLRGWQDVLGPGRRLAPCRPFTTPGPVALFVRIAVGAMGSQLVAAILDKGLCGWVALAVPGATWLRA